MCSVPPGPLNLQTREAPTPYWTAEGWTWCGVDGEETHRRENTGHVEIEGEGENESTKGN